MQRHPSRLTRLSQVGRENGGVMRELGLPPAVPAGRPGRARWVVALGGVGGLLFTVGLLVRVRCAVGACPAPGVRRLFALDGLGVSLT